MGERLLHFQLNRNTCAIALRVIMHEYLAYGLALISTRGFGGDSWNSHPCALAILRLQ